MVAGLYPLQYVAQRVAGDAFEVENLTQPGGEPHDLELGIGQTAALSDAAHPAGLRRLPAASR